MIYKIIIFNIFFLFFNIIMILKKKSIYELKNVDLKIIFLSTFSYKNISYYLNSKYFSFKKFNEILNIKKNISLYYVNFNLYHPRQIKIIMQIETILSQKFNILYNKNNPEYLIYNVFGCNHLNKKYENSIKIAYYTENQIPDFNINDYAIGQAHINYLDRYLKIPYVVGYYNSYNNNKYKSIRKLALNSLKKRKFCAAVISNHKKFTKFRIKFINELNKYKRVDMGGKYNNNVGKIHNKIQFLRSYKFYIAMENSEGDGYFSEKIIDSFLSGTIPIYYGDYRYFLKIFLDLSFCLI